MNLVSGPIRLINGLDHLGDRGNRPSRSRPSREMVAGRARRRPASSRTSDISQPNRSFDGFAIEHPLEQI